MKEGYKHTEVGVIPNDWEVKKLKDLANIEYGFSLPEAKRRGGDYPVLGSNGMVGYHDEYFVEGPTIILGRKGSIDKVTLMDENCCPIDTTYYMKPKKDFSWYWMYSILSLCDLRKLNAASGVPSLNRNDLYAINIGVPPLPEQQKIASILSTVDEHIEQVDGMIEDLKEMKKGLMQKLLTKGIGHTEFKHTEVGVIPETWELKRIGKIAVVVTGKTPSTSCKEYYGEKYPWVTPSDIEHTSEIKVTERMLSEEGFYNAAVRLPKNTLLITCIASIGKNAILKEEGSCNQQINAVLPNDEVFDIKFLYYYITKNKVMLERLSGQTAVPILNKSSFEKIVVSLPPLQEQQKIASILSSVDERIETYEQERKDLTELKKGLMQQLLTGKVRVEI